MGLRSAAAWTWQQPGGGRDRETHASDVRCNIHSNQYASFPVESLTSSGASICAALPASMLNKLQTDHFITSKMGTESNCWEQHRAVKASVYRKYFSRWSRVSRRRKNMKKKKLHWVFRQTWVLRSDSDPTILRPWTQQCSCMLTLLGEGWLLQSAFTLDLRNSPAWQIRASNEHGGV